MTDLMLHDTHFHLDLFENPGDILSQIEREKIYTIAVTNLPDLFFHTHTLVHNSKYVRAALGFHPELASQYKHQIKKFIESCGQARYIGEIGLDNFNKSPADYAIQKSIFEKIVNTCNDLEKKILTIHSRHAEKDTIAIVGPKFKGKAILHWYSGHTKEIERALDYGFYFSLNYAMTQSNNGKKIIDCLPVERILLETDGPFITANAQPSTPLLTNLILQQIARLKQQPDIGLTISQNFKNLLS